MHFSPSPLLPPPLSEKWKRVCIEEPWGENMHCNSLVAHTELHLLGLQLYMTFMLFCIHFVHSSLFNQYYRSELKITTKQLSCKIIVIKLHCKERFSRWRRKLRQFPITTMTPAEDFYTRALACARINIYILETRVTSLIWLKECVERPFIPPCSNRLLTEEPFTSTNGECLSAGACSPRCPLKETSPERRH